MNALPADSAGPRAALPPAVGLLTATGTALLVSIPPVMWLANRSSPLLLSLAAAALLTAAVLTHGWGLPLRRLRACLVGPAGLAVIGFLIWSLISLAWSHQPRSGLAMLGELVISLAAGVVVAICWPGPASRDLRAALCWSLLIAGLLVVVELRIGPGLRDALGVRSQLYIFNRPILTALLLIAPAAYGLWTMPGATLRDRLLAGLATLVVIAAILAGESGAARLGLMLMVATWLVARAVPRGALAALALAFMVMMATAPVLGPVADRVLPTGLYQQLARAHARDRVDIWLSFDEAIAARPLLGSGFGTSAALASHPVAAEVSPPRRALLDVGHPHNAFLQIWAETGLVGVLLLTTAGLAFLSRLRHIKARDLAPSLAVTAAALGIACVGHGAWQGWWIAGLGAVSIWFLAVGPADAET